MADVPYLDSGDRLTAERWTTLVTEADARLFKLYSGMPPCLWQAGSGSPWQHYRRFYFWKGALPADAGSYDQYTSIAQAFFGQFVFSGAFHTADPWYRIYDHTPFTDLVALLDLDDPDPDGMSRPAKSDALGVARLRKLTGPELTTYANAIWGVGATGPFDPGQALVYSLEHHKKTFDDKAYAVWISNLPENLWPEFRWRWVPIDVFIGEDNEGFSDTFEWDTRVYNKYQFVRFNNLRDTAVTLHWTYANGTTFDETIPALGCRCVRQTSETGGAYVSPLNYFHTVLPQDPWWLTLMMGALSGQIFGGDGVSSELTQLPDYQNHVLTDPMILAQMMTKTDRSAWPISQMVDGQQMLSPLLLKPSAFWDASPIYNNPSYVGGPKCRVTPSGGYFGAINNDATPLGDLIIHKGTILNARDTGGYVANRRTFEFTGMATLAAGLASVGITLIYPEALVTEALKKTGRLNDDGSETGGGVLIGLSSNFRVALWGKVADIVPGGISNDIVPLEPFAVAVSALLITNIEIEFNTWTYDSDTDTFAYDTDSVTYDTTQRQAGYYNLQTTWGSGVGKYLGLFDTIGDLKAFIAATCAQAYDNTGDITPTVIEMLSTAWGPMVHYKHAFALDYPITTIEGGTPGVFLVAKPGDDWLYVLDQTLQLARTGDFYGGSDAPGFGWPRLGNQFYSGGSPFGLPAGSPAIHWPRFYRRWANYRWVKHVRTLQPFWLLAVDEFDNPIDYYTGEHRLVRTWYETQPIRDARLIPVAKLGAKVKKGIALLGPYSRTYDQLTRLAAWVAQEPIQWQWAGGLGHGPLVTVTEDYRDAGQQTTWFSGFNGANYERGGSDLAGIEQNLLPISIEHYNAVATAVNGVAETLSSELRPLSTFPYFEFFSMESGRNPGQGLPGCTTNFRPREQWLGWDHGANPEITAKFAGWGCPVKTSADFPGELAAFLAATATWYDTGTDDMYNVFGAWLFGTSLSLADFNTMVGNYRWVAITDAVALHAQLGIPFVFEETAFPCSLTMKDNVGTDDYGTLHLLENAAGLVNDEAGAWLKDTLGGGVGPVMRSDLTPDRAALYLESTVPFTPADYFVTLDFEEVNQTFYVGAPEGLLTVLPTWGLTGPGPGGPYLYCKWVLYRRYGAQPARPILWPRNYAAYEAGYESDVITARAVAGTAGGYAGIPRLAVDTLEDAGPTVIDFPKDGGGALLDEFIIEATIQNGELQVYRSGRAIT